MTDATLILVLAIGASGFLHGLLGFGAGILAMSILAATHGIQHAASVVNGTGVLLALGMSIALWRRIQWSQIVVVLPSMLIGVFIGLTALKSLESALMIRVLGVTVVLVSLYYLLLGDRAIVLIGRAWATFAGLSAGILGGAMNIAGPPLVAYFYARPDPPSVNKANVQIIFLVGGSTRLATAALNSMVDKTMWLDMLVATPVLLIGLGLGMALAKRMSPERFRNVSWAAFAVLGLWLTLRA